MRASGSLSASMMVNRSVTEDEADGGCHGDQDHTADSAATILTGIHMSVVT